MSISRSFKKRLLRFFAILGVSVVVVALALFFRWGYVATKVDVAEQAVTDYGYTNATLVSKRFVVLTDECKDSNDLVTLVFDAINTYTEAHAQVVVCASPDRVGKIYIK